MHLRRSRKAKVAASEFVRKVITGQTSGAGPTRSSGKQKQSTKAKRSASRSPSRAGGGTPTQSRASTPSRSPARSQEPKSKSPARGLDASRPKSPARGTKEGTPSSGRESSPRSGASGSQAVSKGKPKASSLSRNKVAPAKLLTETSEAKAKTTTKKSGKKGKETESGTSVGKKGKGTTQKSGKGGPVKSSAKETKVTGSEFTKLKAKRPSNIEASPRPKKIGLKRSDKSAFRSLNNPSHLFGHPGVWPISSTHKPEQDFIDGSQGGGSSATCTMAVVAATEDLDSKEAVAGPSNTCKEKPFETSMEDDILPASCAEGVLRHPAEHLTPEQFFPLVGLVKKSDLPRVDPSRNKLHREAGGKLRRVIKPRIVPEMIYRQFAVSRGCFISDMWSDSDSDDCSGRDSPRVSAPGHILQSEQSKKKKVPTATLR